jgi:hypothetical protein
VITPSFTGYFFFYWSFIVEIKYPLQGSIFPDLYYPFHGSVRSAVESLDIFCCAVAYSSPELVRINDKPLF